MAQRRVMRARLRPQHANHVWSYDFVSAKTHDGRTVRMLNLIDEHTRESLLVRPERRWSSAKVIESLADVMVMKGVPEHIRSDYGPEFVAKDLRKWLADTGAKTLYIEPGSPWENGYCESFNSKLRDEFLNGEIFYSLREVQVLAERWRVHYNTIRPHSSLGYKSPAPETWQPEVKTGYGEVESKVRFHFPTPSTATRYLLIGPGNFEPVEMLVFGKIKREILHEEEAFFCRADRCGVEAGRAGGAGCGGDPEGWHQ